MYPVVTLKARAGTYRLARSGTSLLRVNRPRGVHDDIASRKMQKLLHFTGTAALHCTALCVPSPCPMSCMMSEESFEFVAKVGSDLYDGGSTIKFHLQLVMLKI